MLPTIILGLVNPENKLTKPPDTTLPYKLIVEFDAVDDIVLPVIVPVERVIPPVPCKVKFYLKQESQVYL